MMPLCEQDGDESGFVGAPNEKRCSGSGGTLKRQAVELAMEVELASPEVQLATACLEENPN